MKLLSQEQYAEVLSAKMSAKDYAEEISMMNEGKILAVYNTIKDAILNYYGGKLYRYFKYSSYIKEEIEKDSEKEPKKIPPIIFN